MIRSSFVVAVIASMIASASAAPPPLRHVDQDSTPGSSAAVIVGDATLVYTDQLLPTQGLTDEPMVGNLQTQINNLFEQLGMILRRAGSDVEHVAKLNVYLAKEQVADDVRRALATRFQGDHKPATSFVVTALPQAGAVIALDAVAAAEPAPNRQLVSARYLSPGSRLYVSGQADRATDLRMATRNTLEQLMQTLRHCGQSMDDVVQLKCFFKPMSSVDDVRQEIKRFFDSEHSTPPVVFVEWKALSPPIEIELVAWGGPARSAGDVLEFITPPGMTASPVYSRVARINRGPTIFIGDIAAPTSGSLDEQLQSSFDALGKLLVKTDSDFKHLVKATYYVTDDEIGKAHNTIRPKFYDGARPPAASKALVTGTGHPGSRYVMDMIAVPASR
jgi:enamine deaminase RidA (YjgF/YER057c/UK114 family)